MYNFIRFQYLISTIALIIVSNAFSQTPDSASFNALGAGDILSNIKVPMRGFKINDVTDSKEYYAPVGSTIRILTNVDKDRKVIVVFDKVPANPPPDEATEQNPVKPSVAYIIEVTKLEQLKSASVVQGAVFGALTVPFKFYPYDHSVFATATVGFYGGYRVALLGLQFLPIATFGISVVPITKQENGRSTTSSAPAFTMGGGLIFSIMKSDLLQLGFLVGTDLTGKSNGYKFEGKPWIAASISTKIVGQ